MPSLFRMFSSSQREPAPTRRSHREERVNYGDLRELRGSLMGRTVNVSDAQITILKKADKSIQDTWKILDKGSANQIHDVIYTEGESMKRVSALRNRAMDPEARARRAAKFRAGNCAEMAAVNGLMLANAGLNKPVSVVRATNMDHSIPMIGDPRERDPLIFSDAWPLFGRSDLEGNYEMTSRNEIEIVKTWQPQRANPAVRRELMDRRNQVSHREVDRLYRDKMRARNMPITSEQLRNPDEIYARHSRQRVDADGNSHSLMYQQLDSSRDVNTQYRSERVRSNGNREVRRLRPELPESVYERRLRRLDAATPQAIAHVQSRLGRAVAALRVDDSSSSEDETSSSDEASSSGAESDSE